jgi:polyisoprenyl-phosphate glycosyltransferase
VTSKEKIARLRGPILVLGASGFVGANLSRSLFSVRKDVYAVVSTFPAWRLEGLPQENVLGIDLNVTSDLARLIQERDYLTVFDCVAYGAYSFQSDVELIYTTNINRTVQLTELLEQKTNCTYIHAGSSSEYGDNAAGPEEAVALTPNSHYAVTKTSVANLLYYLGKRNQFACANLRLYAVYGPLEDSSRLIPRLVKFAAEKTYPPFVNPKISRDYVYIDDVVESFVDAALNLRPEIYGESFNIGSGTKTTMLDLARTAQKIFHLAGEPQFGAYEDRKWDVSDWFANPGKASREFGWKATTPLGEGLKKTFDWYCTLADREKYERSSKKYELDTRHSISAIVACYKDGQAIPFMYDRLVEVFKKLKIDYEIIFVNDNSPDNSEEEICRLSASDRRVMGISHSRNFGSQAAFRSGMQIASKNSVVLLDGDLQDPPELIEAFSEKWREGFDVIYGRRVKREAPFYMQIAYKFFYFLFNKFSYINIPRDAGDFSLIDRKVVKCILQFPERDLFLRGVRAFTGFRQTGVDYIRPERMFGRSTNNFLKNVGWAKKGILSFSNTPLNMLSFGGIVLFFLSIFIMLVQVGLKLMMPSLAPRGFTTVIVFVIFFGSLNLFSLSILGEYMAKVFEEVKRRPHFIRRNIIRGGKIRSASADLQRT